MARRNPSPFLNHLDVILARSFRQFFEPLDFREFSSVRYRRTGVACGRYADANVEAGGEHNWKDAYKVEATRFQAMIG